MTKIAIIGTAGRDKTKPMTAALWDWMYFEAKVRVPYDAHVVSGGAAWADHLAVVLFLNGHAKELTLHLPAPFAAGRYIGPAKSSAQAANWYHKLFSEATGMDTLQQIAKCEHKDGIHSTFEPAAPGYGGMFARNLRVSKAEQLLAFTFGEGDVPADGGTKDTWDKCKGVREHVTLPIL